MQPVLSSIKLEPPIGASQLPQDSAAWNTNPTKADAGQVKRLKKEGSGVESICPHTTPSAGGEEKREIYEKARLNHDGVSKKEPVSLAKLLRVKKSPKSKTAKRKTKKTKKRVKKKPKAPSAAKRAAASETINKPLLCSRTLSELLRLTSVDAENACKTPETLLLSRPNIVRGLWEYVKANNLQDPADRRRFFCDTLLTRVLGEPGPVSMFGVMRLLQPHCFSAAGHDNAKSEQSPSSTKPRPNGAPTKAENGATHTTNHVPRVSEDSDFDLQSGSSSPGTKLAGSTSRTSPEFMDKPSAQPSESAYFRKLVKLRQLSRPGSSNLSTGAAQYNHRSQGAADGASSSSETSSDTDSSCSDEQSSQSNDADSEPKSNPPLESGKPAGTRPAENAQRALNYRCCSDDDPIVNTLISDQVTSPLTASPSCGVASREAACDPLRGDSHQNGERTLMSPTGGESTSNTRIDTHKSEFPQSSTRLSLQSTPECRSPSKILYGMENGSDDDLVNDCASLRLSVKSSGGTSCHLSFAMKASKTLVRSFIEGSISFCVETQVANAEGESESTKLVPVTLSRKFDCIKNEAGTVSVPTLMLQGKCSLLELDASESYRFVLSALRDDRSRIEVGSISLTRSFLEN